MQPNEPQHATFSGIKGLIDYWTLRRMFGKCGIRLVYIGGWWTRKYEVVDDEELADIMSFTAKDPSIR